MKRNTTTTSRNLSRRQKQSRRSAQVAGLRLRHQEPRMARFLRHPAELAEMQGLGQIKQSFLMRRIMRDLVLLGDLQQQRLLVLRRHKKTLR